MPMPEISRHSRSSARVRGARTRGIEHIRLRRRRVLDDDPVFGQRIPKRRCGRRFDGHRTFEADGHGIFFRSVALQDERGLLGQDSSVAADERGVAVGDLVGASASGDLPDRVADVVHAARDVGLTEGQLPPDGVAGKVAAKGEVVVVYESRALALGRRSPRPPATSERRSSSSRTATPCPSGRGSDRSCAKAVSAAADDRRVQQILGVGRGLERHMFAESLDPHRTVSGRVWRGRRWRRRRRRHRRRA